MEDWLGYVPVSDRLDRPNSAVFVCYQGSNTSGYFSCRMCSRSGEPLLWRGALQGHIEETLHKQRAEALIKERDAVLERAAQSLRFLADTKRFRSVNLYASIGRYVLDGPRHATLSEVENQTKILRRSDPLVQLELALWKAACESRPPECVVEPRQWKAWYQHGWKDQKVKARRDPFTSIPALVAPFLGLKLRPGFESQAMG